MEDIILKADGLSAGYDRKIVVSGMSFELRRGSILTLIGPNGSGKSTILKTVASQLESVEGTVYLNGKDISKTGRRELARQMSVMLTRKTDPELMTCLDVVSLGRYPYTGQLGILSQADKAAVSEAMRLTGTSDIADRPVTCISDGQRQRVMLAGAVCREPDLLVLDEPTSFLDIHHKTELLGLLRDLVRSRKMSVIMSLHETDLAQKISDEIICIKDGRADRYGTPDEIFSGGYISELYGLSSGSYNELSGCAELQACTGEPEVLVIAGGGTGTPVFRKLQRKGIPFSAGILSENDIDYPAALSLAAEVISEKAFEPVSDVSFKKAADRADRCGKVICALETFGSMNQKVRELAEYCQSRGYVTDKY